MGWQEADAENMCHLVSNMAECVEMTASDTLQLQLICQLVVKLITNVPTTTTTTTTPKPLPSSFACDPAYLWLLAVEGTTSTS